jgi:hypothetical protein
LWCPRRTGRDPIHIIRAVTLAAQLRQDRAVDPLRRQHVGVIAFSFAQATDPPSSV